MIAKHTHWRLIAIGTFAVMLSAWVGSGMARARQDYTVQSARISPQVREAAINAFGPVGLTHGQSLRIGFVLAGPGAGPHVVQLTVSNCQGNTLAMVDVAVGANQCSFFDLNADQLPQGEFDNAGRVEVSVRLKSSGGTNKTAPLLATAQVYDNSTGKTAAMLTVAAGN